MTEQMVYYISVAFIVVGVVWGLVTAFCILIKYDNKGKYK